MQRKEFKKMQLKKLLETIDYTEITNRSGMDVNSIKIEKICSHSNDANNDCVFVCIAGSLVDSHDSKYVSVAYGKGCRIFVVQKSIDVPDDAFVITVKDTRIALAQLSAAFFDNPASKMTLIGITGTKGKTTSSLLIYNVLKGLVGCRPWGHTESDTTEVT